MRWQTGTPPKCKVVILHKNNAMEYTDNPKGFKGWFKPEAFVAHRGYKVEGMEGRAILAVYDNGEHQPTIVNNGIICHYTPYYTTERPEVVGYYEIPHPCR